MIRTIEDLKKENEELTKQNAELYREINALKASYDLRITELENESINNFNAYVEATLNDRL